MVMMEMMLMKTLPSQPSNLFHKVLSPNLSSSQGQPSYFCWSWHSATHLIMFSLLRKTLWLAEWLPFLLICCTRSSFIGSQSTLCPAALCMCSHALIPPQPHVLLVLPQMRSRVWALFIFFLTIIIIRDTFSSGLCLLWLFPGLPG